jgi:predicted nucleic acid-binding protein
VRVVLDTNVLVSGLLSPYGTPARVLDLLTSGLIIPLFDDRIFQEYTDVLARPRFGFAGDDVSTLLAYVRMHDDLPFLEVAAAAGARAVVTGNARHFLPRRGAHGVEVWSPAELLSHFRTLPTD